MKRSFCFHDNRFLGFPDFSLGRAQLFRQAAILRTLFITINGCFGRFGNQRLQ